MINTPIINITVVLVIVAAIAAAVTAITTRPAPPQQLTFDERWGNAMTDIYGSQENLRRSGHVSVKTEIICTKKWCDAHPKGELRPKGDQR